MQQYRLNYGLLIGLIVASVLIAGAAFGLHHYQLDRNADILIESAEKAEAEGDLRTAADEYANYISIRSDDDAARLKLVNLRIDITEQPDAKPEDISLAVASAEDVVRQMPDEKEFQKRVVEMYGRVGALQQALDHLSRMVVKYPDDPKLQVDQFNYLLRTRKFDGTDGALAKGKRLIGYDDKTDKFDAKEAIAPTDPSVYSSTAALLRSFQDKPDLADRVMDQVVEVNPELPAAYLARGQYFVNIGEPNRGQQDINKAYRLAPKDADVLLAMAGRAQARDRISQAHEFLEAGKKEHPEDPRFYQALAELEKKDQKYDEALAIVDEGLKTVPAEEQMNLLFYKAELQFVAKDLDGVDRTKEDMRKAGFGEAMIEWIDARQLLAEEKWWEASVALAALRPKIGDSPLFADPVALQLGLAYEKAGQLDKAETAYKSVLTRNPSHEFAQAGVRRVELMLKRDVKNPETQVLEELLEEELKKPKDEQNWTEVDQKLEELAEKRKIEGAPLDLFWARMMLGRKNFPEARKRLVAAREKEDSVDVRRLAAVLLRAEDAEKGPAKALQLLDQAVEQFGDQPELRLDRADCLISINQQKRDNEKLKQQFADLSKIPGSWTKSEQEAFWRGMAARYLSVGMADEAKASLIRVTELRPKDLPTRVALFGLALEANDDVAMKEAQDQILEVVGSKEDSNWLYSEARRRLSLYRRGQADKESLRDVERLTERAMSDRPTWFELQLLSAELALLKGDEKAALAHFEKAQDLGRPNPTAVMLHVQLLLKNGQLQQARELIEQLPEETRFGNLGRVYAEVLMNTGDVDEAVEVITKYAEADPDAADRQLILGQVLTRATGNDDMSETRRKELLDQAGEALQKAVDLRPESPQTWLALLTYQVVRKDLEAAKQTLQQAQLALAEDQLVAVMAKGNEILGQWFNAENVYLTAMEAQPDNLLLAQELATFYLSPNYPRNDKYVKATPLVNRILKAGADGELEPTDPNLMWARRAAAQMLAETGDYQKLRKAEKLLASNAVDGTLPAQERLQMANILARRPDPISRNKAKQLFEQVQEDQRELNLKDALTLGQLYYALGQWEQCKRHMRRIVLLNRDSADARVIYANMLLGRGSEREIANDAKRQIEELRKIAPNDARTIQLIVQLFGKTGNEQRGRDYLLGLVPKVSDPKELTDQQAALLEFIAGMFVQLDDFENAEKIYRAVVAKNPSKVLALAAFLGTNRDVDQSFEILDAVYKPELTEPLSRVGIGIVRARRDEIGDKYDAKINGWLDRGLLENPGSISLLMLQAEFADVEKNYDEAAGIYKKLLARNDVKDVTRAIVLNNLAFLVALADNADETGVNPLKLIDQAIEILGPTADILDTRAVVYIAQGDYQKAIRDLDNSLTDNPTSAKYFHKAVAHLNASENTAAIKAWEDAHQLDDDVRSTLNRMEYEQYDRTKAEIEKIRAQSQSLTRATS